MGRILGKTVICAIAGILGWVFVEPMFPKLANDPSWTQIERYYVLAVSMLIGGAAGFFHGAQKGGRLAILVGCSLGLAFGAVGGMLGHAIGSGLVSSFFRGDVFTIGMSLETVTARALAIAPWGLLLGAGIGATLMSRRGVISGALGGLVGGAISGGLFDLLGGLFAPLMMVTTQEGIQEVGGPSRAMLALLFGLTIGLMTAIFEHASRRAWLRLILGKNEGKEWPIDAQQTMIGNDERAHVPLFGDPQIPQLAAVIQQQNGQYVLSDPGSPLGLGLNGYQVTSPAYLTPGDMISIGPLQLQFLMKAGSAQKAQEGRPQAVPIQKITPDPLPPQPVQQQPAPISEPTVMTPTAGIQGLSLVILSGAAAGDKTPIGGPVDIGREASGIRLAADQQASRRHCQVEPSAGALKVTDLGSTNGTFINGIQVQNGVLNLGDELRVGSTTFRVETV
jgi:pSer/pThr/pTyr-binding forkhead associated (FHA) protein